MGGVYDESQCKSTIIAIAGMIIAVIDANQIVSLINHVLPRFYRTLHEASE